LPLLEEIRIPRWLTCDIPGSQLEIHGFADASERAYAAVVYLRTRAPTGRIKVRLVSAKTKVAPLKQVSLPRLELCAATLLARLVLHVTRTLEMNNASIFLWSDSTVTLGWIKAHPVTWKTYVANRVSEIQTSLPSAHWMHVSSRDNPADCASRGSAPRELMKYSLWWNGPPWLWVDGERWTTPADDAVADGLPERRIRAHVTVPAEEKSTDPDLLTRYSHLNRLLRITAWCRRWLPRQRASQRCTYRPFGHLAPSVLRVVELEEARLHWIRQIQAAHFRKELAAIKQGGVLSVRGPLTKLNPVLDENGVLRVGGRLRNAPVQYDAKHPIILPGASLYSAHRRRFPPADLTWRRPANSRGHPSGILDTARPVFGQGPYTSLRYLFAMAGG